MLYCYFLRRTLTSVFLLSHVPAVPGRAEHIHVVLQAAHRVLETVQPEREVQQRQVARLHQPDAAQRRQHGDGNAGRTRRGRRGRSAAAATPAQPVAVRRAQRRGRHTAGPQAADHQRGPQPTRRYGPFHVHRWLFRRRRGSS